MQVVGGVEKVREAVGSCGRGVGDGAGSEFSFSTAGGFAKRESGRVRHIQQDMSVLPRPNQGEPPPTLLRLLALRKRPPPLVGRYG